MEGTEMKHKLSLGSLILIIMGVSCFIAFKLMGSEVDSQGVLQEPFFLLPIGSLFVVLGGIGFVVTGIRSFFRK